MIFALVDNEKTIALPKLSGKCPHCGSEVIAKCGEIRAHHWAHQNDYSCDSWHNHETEWHISWKAKFGDKYSEIKILKGDEYHIADVKTKSGVVIEFQNSKISKAEILRRESFYDKMIWVINGTEFKSNFLISKRLFNRKGIVPANFFYVNDSSEGACWVLKLNDKELNHIQIKWLNSKGFIYDRNENNCFLRGFEKNTKWNNRFLNEIHSFNYNLEIFNLKPDEMYFNWTYHTKSWDEAKKPIFIDLDDDNLYWIKEKYSYNNGKIRIVPKETFLKKYRD